MKTYPCGSNLNEYNLTYSQIEKSPGIYNIKDRNLELADHVLISLGDGVLFFDLKSGLIEMADKAWNRDYYTYKLSDKKLIVDLL